jgi:regulator of PEP synthase PpsR (kinase-PPPase family)
VGTPGSNSKSKKIFGVSDGTGETAGQITDAAMVQFGEEDVTLTRFKSIRSETQLNSVCEDAEKEHALIIFTLVSPTLRSHLIQQARLRQLTCVDLLGPLLVGLGTHFGHEPKFVAGLLHSVNDRYFARIDAMEFTIDHDDGRDTADLEQADLVLLGISRTSKTPLSMYLSHQGWKVANIPLIRDFTLPPELFKIDQRRIAGLTIDADDLAKIRRNRLMRLGHARGGDYADPERVAAEIEFANEIFRKNRRWPVFNVTGKALEETASEIMKLMVSRGLAPPAYNQTSAKKGAL